MTKREVLARIIKSKMDEMTDSERSHTPPMLFWDEVVYALLQELREPDEGMLGAMDLDVEDMSLEIAWRRGIDHLMEKV